MDAPASGGITAPTATAKVPSRGSRMGSAAKSSATCVLGANATQLQNLDYSLVSTIAYFSIGAQGQWDACQDVRRSDQTTDPWAG